MAAEASMAASEKKPRTDSLWSMWETLDKVGEARMLVEREQPPPGETTNVPTLSAAEHIFLDILNDEWLTPMQQKNSIQSEKQTQKDRPNYVVMDIEKQCLNAALENWMATKKGSGFAALLLPEGSEVKLRSFSQIIRVQLKFWRKNRWWSQLSSPELRLSKKIFDLYVFQEQCVLEAPRACPDTVQQILEQKSNHALSLARSSPTSAVEILETKMQRELDKGCWHFALCPIRNGLRKRTKLITPCQSNHILRACSQGHDVFVWPSVSQEEFLFSSWVLDNHLNQEVIYDLHYRNKTTKAQLQDLRTWEDADIRDVFPSCMSTENGNLKALKMALRSLQHYIGEARDTEAIRETIERSNKKKMEDGLLRDMQNSIGAKFNETKLNKAMEELQLRPDGTKVMTWAYQFHPERLPNLIDSFIDTLPPIPNKETKFSFLNNMKFANSTQELFETVEEHDNEFTIVVAKLMLHYLDQSNGFLLCVRVDMERNPTTSPNQDPLESNELRRAEVLKTVANQKLYQAGKEHIPNMQFRKFTGHFLSVEEATVTGK